MRRSKRHVVIGLGFVLASVVVAGGIYFGLNAKRTQDQTQAMPSDTPTPAAAGVPQIVAATAPAQPVVSEAAGPQNLAEFMVGTFAEGIASNAVCEGRMWEFREDGTLDLIGNDNELSTTGRWRIADGTLYLTDMTSKDVRDNDAQLKDMTFKVSGNGDRLTIGDSEYIACAPSG